MLLIWSFLGKKLLLPASAIGFEKSIPRKFAILPKKISYIFSRKTALIFQETETSKKLCILCQKKAFLFFRKTKTQKKLFIFQETETLIIFLSFQKQNFPSFKNGKNLLWKNWWYFWKWNFLAPSLKNFLYFSRNLQSPKNQHLIYFSKHIIYKLNQAILYKIWYIKSLKAFCIKYFFRF